MQKVKYVPGKNYPAEKVSQLMQAPDKALPWTKRPLMLAAMPCAAEEPAYICHIQYFEYDIESNQGNVDVVFAANLEAKQVKPLEHIQMTGTLLDLERKIVVGELQPVEAFNNVHCELRTGFFLDTPIDKPENLALLVETQWKDAFGESGMELFHENNSQGDFTYEHIRPKKEESPVRIGGNFLDGPDYTDEERRPREKSERIRIAFKRAPEAAADVDYICMFGTVKDDHPNFGVPGRGILRVESGNIITEGDKKPRATCTVVTETGIVRKTYDFDCPESVFQNDGGGLKYDIATGWNQRYEEPGNFVPVVFDYTLEIEATFQLGGREKRVVHTVTSRRPETNVTSNYYIPKLEIMWGCFADDAKILMMNGEEKPAREVRIGDWVSTAQGSRQVTNVWKGQEEKLIRLTTASGRQLDLTGNHPVLTSQGWYWASALQPGMQVKTETSQEEVKTAAWVDYGREVYNFQLAQQGDGQPVVMFANGLAVSDFTGQNQIRCAGEK